MMADVKPDDADLIADAMMVTFGVPFDEAARRVDGWMRDGKDAGQIWAVFNKAAESANGQPLGYMVRLLQQDTFGKAGTTEHPVAEGDADWLYRRYHRGKERCSCCPGAAQ